MLHQAVYQHQGFSGLARFYYNELVSRNPVTATRLGEHSFDGLLPETGAEAVERNISFLRDLKSAFSSLPENDLSVDERMDREAIIHFADQQLFREEDLKIWRMGRDLAIVIGDALFLLFIRDFAPLSERVKSMTSRLKAVPIFLTSGRTLFQKVPRARGELYLESAARLPLFLDTIEESIRNYVPPVIHQEFSRAAKDARKSLVEFANWLKHAIMPNADAEWAMGSNAFQAFLANRKTGMTQSEIIELGQRTLNEASGNLESLSCVILGAATGAAAGARNEAFKRVMSHGPASFDQALAAYRESANRTRAFIEYSDFATLPEKEELEIIETPSYMRHVIPDSAYFGPERKADSQRGFYLLTRDSAHLPAKHSYAGIANRIIHHGYPGHHLHLSAQNFHPGILRAFTDNQEISEGWASYCQDALREKGFETTSESLFAQAVDKAFNAALLLTDVNLQTRAWNKEQAIQFLVEQTRIEKDVATAEIQRQIIAPGCHISRLTGHHLLLGLKNQLQQNFGNDFTDRTFHDLILYQGGIPISVARSHFPEIVKLNLKSRNRA
ncbi:MAG: DUF885 family protein [Candidatus Riflebacteria bacterium]|nr:DUF885 family protein [Candidatus Riflebacteria bacterium]